MDEALYKEYRKATLRKLFNAKKIGGSHTHFKHMKNAIPRHSWGDKESREAIKDLIKEEFILTKQTIQEPHVSLNPRKIKEIKTEIGIM